MKQKQLKVALPDGLRGWLEKSAAKDGVSLAEQIRMFLEQASVETAFPPALRDLVIAIRDLGPLVKMQTGYEWYQSPEAFEIFSHALFARLERWRPPKPPSGKPAAMPVELASPSSDPKQIGHSLDAILFSRGSLIVEQDPTMLKDALKAAMRERDKDGRRRRGPKMKDREERS